MTALVRAVLAIAVLAAPAAAEPTRGTAMRRPPAPGSAPAEVQERGLSIDPVGHAFTRLSIDNPLGDVRIEGYDGTAIQIATRKTAPDEDALDRLHVSLADNPDGTVTIRTTADGGREQRPVARAAVRLDLVIRAPRDVRIEAAVGSGMLEVVNMDAGSDLDTGSGPISVRNVQGDVLTHSISGQTRLAQVFGSVDAQTLMSDLDLDTIGGDRLIASVHHGRIEGRRVRARDIELTATDGRIVLEAEAALRGRLIVSSFRGDVEVQLHRHGAVAVRARGARVDLGGPTQTQPNGWVAATIGAGGTAELVETAHVELRAANGNVKFAIIESRP